MSLILTRQGEEARNSVPGRDTCADGEKGKKVMKNAYVRPSKPMLTMGFVVSLCFLVFGIVFFIVLTAEGAVIGQIFMVFWMFVCLLIAGFYAYQLIHYKDPVKSSPLHIGIINDFSGSSSDGDDTKLDFDTRLRKLEGLKKEGLISQEEYNKKRAEIMKERW